MREWWDNKHNLKSREMHHPMLAVVISVNINPWIRKAKRHARRVPDMSTESEWKSFLAYKPLGFELSGSGNFIGSCDIALEEIHHTRTTSSLSQSLPGAQLGAIIIFPWLWPRGRGARTWIDLRERCQQSDSNIWILNLSLSLCLHNRVYDHHQNRDQESEIRRFKFRRSHRTWFH